MVHAGDHQKDAIQNRTDFDFVRYANCWEDADTLIEALQPATGKRVLSIASAGDNVLALLASGAEVVAADINPAQLACVELKWVAFQELNHEQLLAFLGVREADNREDTYGKLRRRLTEATRAYWARHPHSISQGVVHAGKFEAYFQLFRRRVLPWIHARATVAQLFEPRGREDRLAFWTRRWNNRRWRWLLRLFFGRFAMGRLGRDPEFFRYVQGSIGDQVQARVRYAMTELVPAENPYLEYIATGNFGQALPYYLRPENYAAIRDHLDNLSWYEGPIEEVARAQAGGGFDGINLSDIFEYVSEETAAAMYGAVLQHARPDARIAYWNTFVPRRCPDSLLGRVEPLDGLAGELHARDKAFFYSRFHVDRVRPSQAGSGRTVVSGD